MIAKPFFFNDSQLLESPRFDHENSLLYFVSIYDNLIYCIDVKSKEITTFLTNSPVSYIQIIEYKKIIYAEKDGIYNLDLKKMSKKLITQLETNKDYRYNDGISDARGRLLIGTMGYPSLIENGGKVFSYFQKKSKIIIDNTTISNGICFSKDNKKMYFIDTPTRKVKLYNYFIETGDVEFEKDLIEFNEKGLPDGMCIDNNENLWVAEWSGSCVSQFDSISGKKIKSISLPCSNVTSCCLDNFGNLYVTTAKNELIDENYAGGVFYIKLNEIEL